MKHLYYPMNITFPGASLNKKFIPLKCLNFSQAAQLTPEKICQQVNAGCKDFVYQGKNVVTFPTRRIEVKGKRVDLVKDRYFCEALFCHCPDVSAIAFYGVFASETEIVERLIFSASRKGFGKLFFCCEKIVLKRQDVAQ